MQKKNISIALASDHAGFRLKGLIKELLEKNGIELEDYGTNSEESVDYPDFVHPLSHAVESGVHTFGIIMCGSGNGVSMTANKYAGIRAALCWQPEIARLARAHNNANVLAFPARYIDEESAIEAVLLFLNTDFEGGRHVERVNKIQMQ